ncbi:MAG: DUF84 family protein [Ignavibacteriae bacterium]|nr:DUF84 family protein [Ignavibacteria bacterium]MBI3364040.1 DUF84 family protein [Ignavibacteriota bacterium]
MIIAIASTRGPKVEAARRVLQRIGRYLSSSPSEFLTYDVDGGIDMPRSLDDLMRGAEQRVIRLQQALRSEGKHADYFVGMEGGFHSVHHNGNAMVFLQSWAYVSDGQNGYFGSSGNVAVPDVLVEEVMAKRRDLGIVIDEVAQQHDVRSKQGTWGILTKDLLTRQESFEAALLAAFAPFYNREMYFDRM